MNVAPRERAMSLDEPEPPEIEDQPRRPPTPEPIPSMSHPARTSQIRQRDSLNDTTDHIPRRRRQDDRDPDQDMMRMSAGINDGSLLDAWRMSNTTGAGVDMLRDRADGQNHDTAFVAFMADRVDVAATLNKNQKKQAAGKNLVYNKADESTRNGLDASRMVEWQKWCKFNAGKLIRGDLLNELIGEGHKMIPTQWIETDRNSHKRREDGIYVPPDFKSRLVGCGQLEDCDGLRTDSPTCESKGLNLILSWTACSKNKLKSADISNAYFQGQPLDRLLLLKPPSGGLPGEGDIHDAAILARVPIYGTKDAGRRFWKRLREVIRSSGLKPNRQIKALYSFEVDGDVKCMLATHVDDLLWSAKPGYEYLMEKVLKEFDVRKVDESEFRFCGREIAQDDEYNIKVTCKDTAEKILPVNWRLNGRQEEAAATPGEIAQLRSVVGSLAWITRQCRPELGYYCSRLQSVCASAKVKYLLEANKVLQMAIAGANDGLYFKAGAFEWKDAVLCSITDASWANETKVQGDQVFPRRSQMGRFTVLAGPDIWNGEKSNFHVIGWKSNMIKRLCRSTMQAETQASVGGMEEGIRIRAAIADMRGVQETGDWFSSSRKTMRHLWVTDCDSLNKYCNNPIAAGCEDKRLEIDLEDLRQVLWEDEHGDQKDSIEEDQQDKLIWIDTSAMLADPLTKGMKATRMLEALKSGVLDFEATDEAKMQKMLKQKQRAKKTAEKSEGLDGTPPQDPSEPTY